MFICILATNENVEQVRERAKQIEKFAERADILKIPVSESGEAPATHWFCWFKPSEEVKEKIFELQDLSEVEISSPINFLEKKNLKRIDKKDSGKKER